MSKQATPNLLDRVVDYFAPEVAARRMKARTFMAALDGVSWGYESVNGTGPSRNYKPVTRDADGDILSQLGTLRGQSRDLARNHPIAAGAINTNVDRIVGTGLALQPEPDRHVLGWSDERMAEWKAHAQREFSLWSDSLECDLTLAGNFYDRQGLVLRTALESGDSFTILPDGEASARQPYRLRLQIIEADRVGNPGGGRDTAQVAGGIRRNAVGAPEAYHVYDHHPGTVKGLFARRYAGTFIDRVGESGRLRILHHCRFVRPEQSRGVPYLAPIIDLLKQLGRYTQAEVQAAVISAFFTVFVTTESGQTAPVFGAGQVNDPSLSQDLELGPAAIVGLAKGEKIEIADPSRPNTAFDAFVAALIKQIGVALSLPSELLMKQFNASYSASKAALLDAWVYFRSMRVWLARSFCQPVYETWMAEAVALGRIAAPGFFRDPLMRWAYTRANWFGDSMGSINPKDEVAAYLAAVDGRLMTRERAEWELFGTGWDSTLEQKTREQQQLAKRDLLPVAKPGAPAPQDQPAKPADPAKPDPQGS